MNILRFSDYSNEITQLKRNRFKNHTTEFELPLRLNIIKIRSRFFVNLVKLESNMNMKCGNLKINEEDLIKKYNNAKKYRNNNKKCRNGRTKIKTNKICKNCQSTTSNKNFNANKVNEDNTSTGFFNFYFKFFFILLLIIVFLIDYSVVKEFINHSDNEKLLSLERDRISNECHNHELINITPILKRYCRELDDQILLITNKKKVTLINVVFVWILEIYKSLDLVMGLFGIIAILSSFFIIKRLF